MSYAPVDTVGNGVDVLFSFPFEKIQDTDIKVTLGGVAQSNPADFTVTGSQVQFTTPPGVGVAIRIYRETSIDSAEATFYLGSTVRAADLNDNFSQNRFKLQELAGTVIFDDGSRPFAGDLDMGGHTVTNLAAPSAESDSATKKYVDDRYGQLNVPGVTRWRKTATDGQTLFTGAGDYGGTLAYSAGRETVYINGVLQQREVDYTATDNTSITFGTGLIAGDIVELHCVNNAAGVSDNSSSAHYFVQDGSGAVTRTVQNKLRDIVSVKDFGAVGDGVTDDTAAIQAAIDAHNNVYIPAGTYRCNSSINLKSNLHLSGIKGSTVLRQYGSNLFVGALSMVNCVVESFTLDYRKTPSNSYDCAFKLKSHAYCKFSNFEILRYNDCTVFERICTAADTVNMVFNEYTNMFVNACNTLDIAAGYEGYQYVHVGDNATTVLNTGITWPEQFNSSVVVLKESSRRILSELTLNTDYTVSYPSGVLTVTLTAPATTSERVHIYPSCPINDNRRPISNNTWESIRCLYVFSRGHVAYRWLDAETYKDEHIALAQDFAVCYDTNPYTTRGGQAGDFNTYLGCVLTYQPALVPTPSTLRAFKFGPGSFNMVGDAVKCDLTWVSGASSTAIQVLDNGLVDLTGTVAITTGSPTVTGTGTVFRNELSLVGSVKDVVRINGNFYGIQSIDSDTQLTLTSNALTTASGAVITRHNYSDAAGYDVNFSSIGAGTNNRRLVQTEGGHSRSRSRTLDYGTATILSGQTSVVVNHRLWRTFSPYEIQLTAANLLNGRTLSVSNITATTFQLNLSSAAAANYTIGYKIELLPLNSFEAS